MCHLHFGWLDRVHKHFRSLRPDIVPKKMSQDQASSVRLSHQDISVLEELRENPFKQRICEAFSRDGQGNLAFEDFLDLLSVFSEHCPRDIKVFYAFKIYGKLNAHFMRWIICCLSGDQWFWWFSSPLDYDRDGYIGQSDLKSVITALTLNELTPEEHELIAENVLEEADVDGDGKLSFSEFDHVVSRAPDFLNTFHIRLWIEEIYKFTVIIYTHNIHACIHTRFRGFRLPLTSSSGVFHIQIKKKSFLIELNVISAIQNGSNSFKNMLPLGKCMKITVMCSVKWISLHEFIHINTIVISHHIADEHYMAGSL